MKIFLTDQTKNLEKHLEILRGQEIIYYNKIHLTEKMTSITVQTSKDLEYLDTAFFWSYNIFPNNLMTYLTEWNFQNRQMQIGDTIVQQAFIPPFRLFSQKIIFGVRINKIIKEDKRIGFSYETINGHVEMGESTFTIEKTDQNKTIFKIHTFSKPGNLLTRIIGPIFSVPYQTFCTKHGLENVRKQLED